MQVLAIAEFWRQSIVTVLVFTLQQDTNAPAALNLGQFMKASTTPMMASTSLKQDFLITNFCVGTLSLTRTAQIIRELSPLQKKRRRPPPPSKMLSPRTRIELQRVAPMMVTGAMIRQTCQQGSRLRKSRAVRSTRREAQRERVTRVMSMVKVEEKPVKQLSQKVANSRKVWTVTAVTRAMVARVYRESLRWGAWRRANARRRKRQLPQSGLQVRTSVEVELLRAKMPRNSTATSSNPTSRATIIVVSYINITTLYSLSRIIHLYSLVRPQLMKQDELPQPQPFAQQRVIDHPPVLYSISEVYSIRKETINSSNDQIYKRLSRQFQRIKRIKSEPNGPVLLGAEYDYESSGVRREFKRLHELYNQSSKSHLIVKRRIEKMRQKVDRIKVEIDRDEFAMVKEVDLAKLISKNGAPTLPSGQSASSLNLQGSKQKM